jgi:hypothetical protein
MSRDLSLQFLDEIFAESTGATVVTLLRVQAVANNGSPITLRFVNDTQPIVSQGQLYQPAVFNMALGRDASDSVTTVNLSFDVGDRQLVSYLREVKDTPKFYISAVVAERPDTVELAETEYELNSFTINNTTITMVLTVEPVLNEPIPADLITPLTAPAMFENVKVDNVGAPRQQTGSYGDKPNNGNNGGGGGAGPIDEYPEIVIP